MKQLKNSVAPAMRVFAAMATLAAMLTACDGGGGNQSRIKTQDAAVYNTQLGITYMHQGELAVAKDKLDRAVKQNPDYAPGHSARASLYDRLGKPDVADSEFRTALHLAPHDPEMINNYAVYLCQNGRTDEGVKRFLEAAGNPLYRTPEAAYTNAGVCLSAAKRDEEARAQFVKALQTRPDNAEAAYQLANLQFRHKEYPQARALIDAFLANFPQTADLLLLGVRVARAQGDPIAGQRFARKLQTDFAGSEQTRALSAVDHPPG